MDKLYSLPDFKHLWRLVDWLYGTPSTLVVMDGNAPVATIASADGVKQGCILAAALFTLGSIDSFNNSIHNLKVEATAIMDDLNFIGQWKDVMTAYDQLLAQVKDKGMDLCPNKCRLLWTDGDPPPDVVAAIQKRGIYMDRGFTTTLGTTIGLDRDGMSKCILDQIRDVHQPLFAARPNEGLSVQAAMAILRQSGVPRLNYLSRVLAPEILHSGAVEFDRLVLASAASKLRIPFPLNNGATLTLQLPIREGGFGLRSMVRTSPAAWWCGLTQAAPWLTTKPKVATFDLSVPFIASLRNAHQEIMKSGEDGLFPEVPALLWNDKWYGKNAGGRGLQRLMTGRIESNLACQRVNEADRFPSRLVLGQLAPRMLGPG